MSKKVLIVEDQFVEANDLQIMLKRAGYSVCGIARSVVAAQEMIRTEQPDLVLLDIFLSGKLTGIDLATQLKEDNIAFIYLSANSNEEILSAAKTTEPYGFIVKPFREKDLLVTLEIAQYRHEHGRETKYRRESELFRQLEKIITSNTEWKDKLLQTGKIIQLNIPFDLMAIGFDYSGQLSDNAICFLRIGFNEYQTIGVQELLTITGINMKQLSAYGSTHLETFETLFFNDEAFEILSETSPLDKLFKRTFQVESKLSLPLQLASGERCSISFFSRRTDAYTQEHINTLQHLQNPLTGIIGQIFSSNATTGLNKPLSLAGSIQSTKDKNEATNPGFEGIIGSSHLLLGVFDHVTQVAPFDTAVLILGESGTGKERIAECIHNLSPRKRKPLIKLNCATLPATLIESELFGHEKGSFTGAIDKRTGKFEQANGGTIFLDEIGEMPVDLQVKLLRVLQEKEIEPIGSRSTIKIDVRIIAATNRNLEKEVAEGRFRLDLYYRLNVFPIELPPLRARTEDLPALSNHFINYYNRKAGKKIRSISEKGIQNMKSYHWPGNIRELENLIERSVLLTNGQVIEDLAIPLSKKNEINSDQMHSRIKTIHENERDYIISILKKCEGRIWGNGGAAEVLNIPPTTLKSKMKKLGIPKQFIE